MLTRDRRGLLLVRSVVIILVIVGGALGAVTRYLLARAVQSRLEVAFPYGTLAVNLTGSFLLGCLAGAGGWLTPELYAGLAAGVCGALTTYSTFAYETWELGEQRRFGAATVNVVGTILGCSAVLYAGYALVTWVVSGGS